VNIRTARRSALALGSIALVARLAFSVSSAQAQAAPTKPAPPTAKELAAAKRKQAESAFTARDTNRDGKLRGAELPKSWDVLFDLDGDGDVQKKEFLEIRTHPVLKAAHPMRHASARMRQSLRQFDQDKDGQVSLMEYPGTDSVFKSADRSKDGFLDKKELLRLAKKELEGVRKKMKSASRYEFLQIFDLNRDQNISPAEYDGPARIFAKFDKNNDGTVSYGELYPERMMGGERAKPEPESKTVVHAMDADEDGKVSREEFKGTDAAWKRLDRNRDGFLTPSDKR
jgi:Ca2+-binding EF-hand superfamily protein